MQVHLDAPQADLNAWGTREEQDLYQSYFEWEKLINIMIFIDFYAWHQFEATPGRAGFRTCVAFVFGSPKSPTASVEQVV